MENIFQKADEVFNLLQIPSVNVLHVYGKMNSGKTFLAGLVAQRIFDYNFGKYYKSLVLLESNEDRGVFMDAFQGDYECLTSCDEILYDTTTLITNNRGNFTFELINTWRKSKIYDLIIVDNYEALEGFELATLRTCKAKNSDLKLLIFSITDNIDEIDKDFTVNL